MIDMDTINLMGENSTVKIEILGRENPTTNDYWDGNWLNVNVYLELPEIKASYRTNIRVDEIQAFLEKLVDLNNKSTDTVELTTMEEGIYLCLENQKNGSILITGRSVIEMSGKIEYRFTTDILSLDRFYTSLKSSINQYPLVGV